MNRTVVVVVVTSLVLVAVAEPALAGPGGRIARAAFETFWGRIILGALVIVFAPLIVLSLIRERRAARRASADLAYLARMAPEFEWLSVRERVGACFHRVHAAWSREHVSEAAEFMTDWYWRNQQLVHLDHWASEGLVNHCDVKSVSRIRPLLVQHRGEAGEHDGSRIVVSITAKMRDYLARRDSDEIVEGSKRYKEVETLWTFELDGRRWKVSNIEQSDMMDDYLQIAASLPKVEESVQPHPREG